MIFLAFSAPQVELARELGKHKGGSGANELLMVGVWPRPHGARCDAGFVYGAWGQEWMRVHTRRIGGAHKDQSRIALDRGRGLHPFWTVRASLALFT